ncbi:MAG: AAA family ATPase [Acidobacteriaceae bacterium]
MLIVFGGLPATGKTTLSRAVAQRLGALYLRIDTIEQAIRSESPGTDVGAAGYVVAYRIAADNLEIDRRVVCDSVNPLRITRDAWFSVAEQASVKMVEVEVICSNIAEHRDRVEGRKSDIDGLKLPSWQDVMNREYEAWHQPHVVIDTASRTVEDSVTELLAQLSAAFDESQKLSRNLPASKT